METHKPLNFGTETKEPRDKRIRSWKEKLRLQLNQLIDSGLVVFSLWTAESLELRLEHKSTTSSIDILLGA